MIVDDMNMIKSVIMIEVMIMGLSFRVLNSFSSGDIVFFILLNICYRIHLRNLGRVYLCLVWLVLKLD